MSTDRRKFGYGFEWEFWPEPYSGFKRDLNRKKIGKVGVDGCGCPEFKSKPVYNWGNFERKVFPVVEWLVDLNIPTRNGLGIHFSISNHRDIRDVHLKLVETFELTGSDEFFMSMGKRSEECGYRHQQRLYPHMPIDKETRKIYDKNYRPNAYNSYLMRPNRHGVEISEFRIWSNDVKNIIPAAQFVHTVVHWRLSRQRTEWVYSLAQYRDWLFKQNGYSELKQHCDWNAIPEIEGRSYDYYYH